LTSRIPEIPLGRTGTVVSLSQAHIPTGFVTLSDVVRLLIEELGVEPRRQDWRTVLETQPSDADGA
jgi:hypothetical protein